MSVTLSERRVGDASMIRRLVMSSAGAAEAAPAAPRQDLKVLLRRSAAIAAIRELFLPRGEVTAEYMMFQALDSLQAMCSYLRGVLTIHATLSGVGVGAGGEAAAAATIAFILKDGSAMLGSLAFNYFCAKGFDADLRWWRLFADLINDVGLTLELLAPLTGPRFFLATTCTANVCKSLCGVAAGATRVAISQHFAVGGERRRWGGRGGGGGGGDCNCVYLGNVLSAEPRLCMTVSHMHPCHSPLARQRGRGAGKGGRAGDSHHAARPTRRPRLC